MFVGYCSLPVNNKLSGGGLEAARPILVTTQCGCLMKGDTVPAREIMMGEGNKVASEIMFSLSKMPGPYVHTASGMHSYLRVVIILPPMVTGIDSLHCQLL